MMIAQISDLHIQSDRRLWKGRYDVAGNLEKCVAQLNALQPDVVIATGDLVNAGLPEEYALLRQLLAGLRAPLYLMPGNHDNRDLMREFFPAHKYLQTGQDRLNYVIEAQGLRIIMLDSLIPGEDLGVIGTAQMAWLSGQLAAAPHQPTVIAVHHPPFPTHPGYMDHRFCADGLELEQCILAYPNVLRVLCGHLHRNIQVNYGGTIGSIAPSTAVTFGLAIARSTFFRSDEPAGYHLHLWVPGKPTMITHSVQLTPGALGAEPTPTGL